MAMAAGTFSFRAASWGAFPSNHSFAVAVAAASVAGLAVRLITLAASGTFPVNDGGMFYTMTRDLQANGFRLPAVTSYNGLELPFAYSPLGFYLCGGLSSLTGVSLLTLFRVVPLVATAAMVPAFALVARAMLPTRRLAAVATAIFAVLPSTFTWSIMGGGVTRSLGLLFALLATHQAHRLFAQKKRRAWIPGGLFVGLALLSHLETGTFAALVFPTFWLAFERDWKAVLKLAGAGGVAALVVAPWVTVVVAQHGPAPFLNAGQTGGHNPFAVLQLVVLTFTLEPWAPVIAFLAAAGAVHRWRRRQRFLAAWPVIIVLLDSRAGPANVAAPAAMLAAIGLVDVVVPFLRRHGEAAFPGLPLPERAFAGLVGVAAVLGCLAMPHGVRSPIRSLSDDSVRAMEWARVNTPADARFLLLTGEEQWQRDALAEWFPAIAERKSVATAQGYEWLGQAAFRRQHTSADDLQECWSKDLACVDEQIAGRFVWPRYLVIARSPFAHRYRGDTELLAEVRSSGAWHEVFANDAVAIFERNP